MGIPKTHCTKRRRYLGMTNLQNQVTNATSEKQMTKKYKYQSLIENFDSECKGCPPAGFVAAEQKAFRWVRNPISPGCLLPPGVRKEKRLADAKTPKDKCGLLGLSMHRSLQESVAAYAALKETVFMADEIFGGHVAEGTLLPVHGCATHPNVKGHFDLYEHYGVNLSVVFSVVKKI